MTERRRFVIAFAVYTVLAILLVVFSYWWTVYKGGSREDGIKLAAVWLSVLTPALTAWISWQVLKGQQSSAVEIEHVKSALAAHQRQREYVRDLYSDEIIAYSSEQAEGLRQAYLLVFEPESSGVGAAVDVAERLEMARQTVMRPLRKHLGVLDEATIRKIYSVHNSLLEMRSLPPEQLKRAKQDFFSKSDLARRYVKADKIAFRLGLITSALEESKLEQEGE